MTNEHTNTYSSSVRKDISISLFTRDILIANSLLKDSSKSHFLLDSCRDYKIYKILKIKKLRGKYYFVPTSSEAFAQRKQDEKLIENF